MSSPWDTTALLASIRRRARSTNSAAPGFADADLLAMANEELASKLAPEMVRLRRDWFEVERDTTLTVGTSTYRLWTRSIMGSARNIGIVSGGVFRLLSYLTPEAMDGKDPTRQATPTHYTIRGTDIVLYPTPNVGDTLRVTCLRRLNRLALPSTAALVTSAPNNLLSVYISPASAAALGFSAGVKVDFIRGDPAFDSIRDDGTITSVSADVSLFFAAGTIPAEMNDGTSFGVSGPYYVCLAGFSPFIQGPAEMFAILAQRVANSLLRPGRDRGILADGERELAALEAAVFGVADRRVETDAQTVGPAPWA